MGGTRGFRDPNVRGKEVGAYGREVVGKKFGWNVRGRRGRTLVDRTEPVEDQETNTRSTRTRVTT